MNKLDVSHYMDDLVNVNEKRVWEMLGDYLANADTSSMCLCSICLVDIAAITLNGIPAHYQAEGNITAAKDRVSDVEIFRELKKAITQVASRPHH